MRVSYQIYNQTDNNESQGVFCTNLFAQSATNNKWREEGFQKDGNGEGSLREGSKHKYFLTLKENIKDSADLSKHWFSEHPKMEEQPKFRSTLDGSIRTSCRLVLSCHKSV